MMRLWIYEMARVTRRRGYRLGLACLSGLLLLAVHQQRRLADAHDAQVHQTTATFAARTAAARADLAEVEAGRKAYDSLWDDPRGYYTWQAQPAPLPEAPFGLLAVGALDLYAPINTVGIFAPAEAAGQALADPTRLLFGSFDPAFVLVFLAPLWVIGLAHGLPTREREQGTLAVCRVTTGSLGRLLVLKFGALYLVTAVPLILLTLAACGSAGLHLLGDARRGPLLLLLLGGYVFFWPAAALLINLYTRTTHAAAMALIGLWALLGFVLPGALGLLADYAFPLSSPIDRITAMRAARLTAEQDEAARAQTAQDEDDHAAAPHHGYFAYYRRLGRVRAAAAAAAAPGDTRDTDHREAHGRLETAVSWLSPTSAAASAMETLAQSAPDQLAAYPEALRRFEAALRRYFAAKADDGTLMASSDLSNIPRFTCRLAPRLDAVAGRVACLWALGAVLVAAAARRLKQGRFPLTT